MSVRCQDFAATRDLAVMRRTFAYLNSVDGGIRK